MDATMLLLHLLQQRSQIVIYSDKWHCWFFLMTAVSVVVEVKGGGHGCHLHLCDS